MKKAPKVGTKVRFTGSCVVSPCVGTVLKIYPRKAYREDADWDGDDMPAPVGMAPESEWKVTLKPDVIPSEWPYKKPDGSLANDVFCPDVSELQPL